MDWDNWGGMEFVAFCTGINLALVSWDQFQTKVRSAQTNFEAAYKAASATIEDKDERAKRGKFYRVIFPFINRSNQRVWHVTYGVSLIMVVAGVLMAYFGKTCPYDFFLLLPTVIYLCWTAVGLLAVKAWIRSMDKLLDSVSQAKAEKKVEDFTKKVEEEDSGNQIQNWD